MIVVDCWLFPETWYVSGCWERAYSGPLLVAMAAASSSASPAIAAELAFGLAFYGILKRRDWSIGCTSA